MNMDSVHNSPDLRWAWLEISQSALRSNCRSFLKLIRPHARLMAVVKADAYGHGAELCARVFSSAGAHEFAVATVPEAIQLRKAGIQEPILVLSEPPFSSIESLVEYQIMPAVQSPEFLLAYGETAASHGLMAPYHLAVDTGMTRAGISVEDIVAFRQHVDFHSALLCAGTFTHFATADELDDWDFRGQCTRFGEAIQALDEAGFDPGLVHCDNTAATLLHSSTHCDMVRVGLGLYGLYPSEHSRPVADLVPAMSLRARVTRVAMPAVGTGVSYGLTYHLPKNNIQIATIPLGYADGLSRALSDKMDVLCHGQRCRQVGRICMDQCMFAVDLNHHPRQKPATPVQVGDVVTLMGADGDEYISADELAHLRDTISYEVCCDFGLRLQKISV